MDKQTPIDGRSSFYVMEKRFSKSDGLPLPGRCLAGPFGSGEEATRSMPEGATVWEFRDERVKSEP